MYHYEYVSKKDAAPYRKNLTDLILELQDEVREHFTFQFSFIGSSSRNMITYDPKTNIGFDFDVNLWINDEDEEYDPDEIRTILRKALERIGPKYSYNRCEDSTRVLTIKHIDYFKSRVEHSCDFAIVYDGKDGQQYIRYNKNSGTYTWEFQKQSHGDLEEKADKLRHKNLWDEVSKIYLDKKNWNTNPDKHSRSLYAETVNECYMRYF